MKEISPMVSVIVLTYNQEQWIGQTLDSILAQKTDYSYEIILGEDKSTDGTFEICKKYADLYHNIKLLQREKNRGLVPNWVDCIKASLGKYIMGCAGDDFWHNPNKIQIQVDYMESHPECVICHTDIDTLFVKTGRLERNSKKSHGIVPPEGRIQQYVISGKECVSAVTMCSRLDAFRKYIPIDKYVEMEFPREDWPTLFILSAYGDINYIPVSTATYRLGQPSITNEIDYDKVKKRYQLDKRMTEYLYSLFPNLGPFKDGWYYDQYTYHSLLVAAYQNNDYKNAKKFAKELESTRLGANRMSKMAKCWLTFKIYKLLKDIKH